MNTNSTQLNEGLEAVQWNNPSLQINADKTEPIPIPRNDSSISFDCRLSTALMHAEFQIRAPSVYATHGQTFAGVHQVVFHIDLLMHSESLGDKHALRWSATITLLESNSSVSISPIFKSKKDADKEHLFTMFYA